MRATLVGLALIVSASTGVARDAFGQSQVLRGVVTDSTSEAPVPGAVVTLLDSASTLLGRAITNEWGQFRFTLLSNGVRHVRVVRLGFRPSDIAISPTRDLATEIRISLVAIPMSLQPVAIVANPRCGRRRDLNAALALLEQARAGLLATVVAPKDKPGVMKRLRATRVIRGPRDSIVAQRVKIDSVGARLGSFGAARSAGDFVESGFMTDSGRQNVYHGPDAEVLLDDRFSSAYCFRVMDRQRDRPNQVGLGFTVAEKKRGRVDLDGALWIDTVARALVDIQFRYVGGDGTMEALERGGEVYFRTMPNGVPVIDHWILRIIGGEVLGELARATWPDSTHWQGALGTLQATLVNADGTPAAGAVVRLEETDYIGTADSSGIVVIPDLVPGPYRMSFVDPDLADLDVDVGSPMLFRATRGETVRRQMTVKTAADYVGERCRLGATSAAKGEEILRGDGWIVGRIVDPTGEPIEDARWSLSYRDLLGERRLFENAQVGSDGIFQFCQLERGSTVIVDAQAKGMRDASVTATLTRKPTVVTLQMKRRN